MDSITQSDTCYLLLTGGRGSPQSLMFRTEEQAQAEFRRISRAPRAGTQWMELSMVVGGGRLHRLASYARPS